MFFRLRPMWKYSSCNTSVAANPVTTTIPTSQEKRPHKHGRLFYKASPTLASQNHEIQGHPQSSFGSPRVSCARVCYVIPSVCSRTSTLQLVQSSSTIKIACQMMDLPPQLTAESIRLLHLVVPTAITLYIRVAHNIFS